MVAKAMGFSSWCLRGNAVSHYNEPPGAAEARCDALRAEVRR